MLLLRNIKIDSSSVDLNSSYMQTMLKQLTDSSFDNPIVISDMSTNIYVDSSFNVSYVQYMSNWIAGRGDNLNFVSGGSSTFNNQPYFIVKYNNPDLLPHWALLGQDIDGDLHNKFGWLISLSSDGTRIAIGTHQSGYVRIYNYNEIDSSWVQLWSDISGSSPSLSSDGSFVATGIDNIGCVRIYEDNGSSWSKFGQDISGWEKERDYNYGHSISLSSDGQTVAFGALYDGSGIVKIYNYNAISASWIQMGQDIVGEEQDDQSGHSVSLSSDGQTVAFGAPYNDGISNNISNIGLVRIYQYNNNSDSWVKRGQDLYGKAAEDYSGWSISLSSGDGSTVAIGDYVENGPETGRARIYKYNDISDSWTQLGGDFSGNDKEVTGWSVSLSSDGNRVAISSPGYSYQYDRDGCVRIYNYNNISDSWIQYGGTLYGEGDSNFYGYSLSLSSTGTHVAIGIPYNNSGHVRIYELHQ